MVLAFGIDLRYAIGASLVAIIATSSGAAAAYVREGYTNVRIGMLLEVATVFGAILGAVVARGVPTSWLFVGFGAVLLWTAWTSRRAPAQTAGDTAPDALAERLRLRGEYPTSAGPRAYSVHGVPAGFLMMLGAGVVSAMLGVGAGVMKVFAMDRLMKIPFKVSTTTSNFMIGVTAAASAGVYLHRGQIDPALAAPVAVGALAGSAAGARILPRIRTGLLRMVFAAVVALVGVQMIYRGFGGRL